MVLNRVAIVTGASRGIGRSIALALASRGAKIVAAHSTPGACDGLLEEMRRMGVECIATRCDFATASDVQCLTNAAQEHFGRIDILVNNAGVTRDGLLMRMSDDDWDRVLSINLKGAFLCTSAVSGIMMRQKRGRIINIASVVGLTGNSGQANYCASKAGLIGLTKSCAMELARFSITVNAVSPGFIETSMLDSMTDKARQELYSRIPLERLGSTEDIANAVLFLASDHSSYITGQVLSVDGGMYL